MKYLLSCLLVKIEILKVLDILWIHSNFFGLVVVFDKIRDGGKKEKSLRETPCRPEVDSLDVLFISTSGRTVYKEEQCTIITSIEVFFKTNIPRNSAQTSI